MGKVVNLPRAEQWAGRICTELGKTVDSIVEVGRLLLKAKADLAHGEWGRMFEDGLIPFSERKAQMLMSVAANPELSNPKHASLLPSSWYSLYELTKLPEPTLKHALKDGLITPDMERSQVKSLLPQPARTSRDTEPAPSAPEYDLADANGTSGPIVLDVEPEEVEEVEGDPQPAAASTTFRRRPDPPSNGLQFARIALMKLAEIQDTDLERQQAFDLVRRWLDEREAQTAMRA